jgi:tyrosyl-tRNA synthetase
LSFIAFLRDIGKLLSINYMIGKESVRSRLEDREQGISYTEFSYMLLQAYDFVHLADKYGCKLQAGGSDQYGNITAGCELSRKMGGAQLYGLVAPLLLDSSGAKMGKTTTGERVDLDPATFSPYRFYQYWFNLPDQDAIDNLRRFSLRPLPEIEDVIRVHDQDRSTRTAQREVARAMTAWVHGDAAIAPVEAAGRVMFGETLEGLTDADLGALAGVVPTIDLPRAELAGGVALVDLLARSFGESKGASRRLVAQGGAYVNNVPITDVERRITLADLATETMLVLSSGRKNRRLVRVV